MTERERGTAATGEPAAAAPTEKRVAHCGHVCKDLEYAICEACKSPVKGTDCQSWAECLAEARFEDTPCDGCEVVPGSPRMRILQLAADLLRADRDLAIAEIAAARELQTIITQTFRGLESLAASVDGKEEAQHGH